MTVPDVPYESSRFFDVFLVALAFIVVVMPLAWIIIILRAIFQYGGL